MGFLLCLRFIWPLVSLFGVCRDFVKGSRGPYDLCGRCGL